MFIHRAAPERGCRLAPGPSKVEGCPIDNVENEEDARKGDEHCHVHGTSFIFLHGSCQFSKSFDFHLEQDDCVFKQSAKHKKDAANHPRLHGVQPVGFWRVSCSCVEDVDL